MLDQIATSGVAVRATGSARVEVRLLEIAGDSIFTASHTPTGRCRGTLLICPPILGESLVIYRREVNLADMLAERGIAVQRFHYRGSGHSGGSEAGITFHAMVDDALAALGALEDRVGAGSVGFLGTRWGALVAAECARRIGGSSLVLWDPVVDPNEFVEEAIRARVMRRMKKGQGRRTPMSEELAQLEQRGWLDILGYRLCNGLTRSAEGHSLTQLLTGWEGALLTVIFGARGGRRAAGLNHVKRIEGALPSGDLVTLPEELPVWFSGRSTQGSAELLGTTSRWILGALSGESDR
jgi:pimeloyl-ACP methyl ester carboxylesterase